VLPVEKQQNEIERTTTVLSRCLVPVAHFFDKIWQPGAYHRLAPPPWPCFGYPLPVNPDASPHLLASTSLFTERQVLISTGWNRGARRGCLSWLHRRAVAGTYPRYGQGHLWHWCSPTRLRLRPV